MSTLLRWRIFQELQRDLTKKMVFLGGPQLAEFCAIEEQSMAGKINIHVITDGEEKINLSVIQQGRDRLLERSQKQGSSKFLELNLTAITLIDGNEPLKEFVQSSARSNLVNSGVFFHFTKDNTDRILSGASAKIEFDLHSILPSDPDKLTQIPQVYWDRLQLPIFRGRL